MVAADREEGESASVTETRDDSDQTSLLPAERIGALTQIFQEYRPETAPEIIERVVKEIDEVVQQVRFTNWQASYEGTREVRKAIRKSLAKFGLAKEQELFDKAYD